MLYISKVTLNTKDYHFKYLMTDCVNMHRFIMSLFPQIQSDDPRGDGRILYTVDSNSDNNVVYVQSAVEPVWNREDTRITSISSRNMDALLGSFKSGKVMNFTLLANPRKHKAGEKYRYERISDKSARAEWLSSRMPGCQIVTLLEHEYITLGGHKRSNDNVRLCAQRYSGQLLITDEKTFCETFLNGVGPSKAYGCGMMMLFRARNNEVR